MNTPGYVKRVFFTMAITAALWVWTGGVSSAQEGEPPVCPPCVGEVCPPCVECGSPTSTEGQSCTGFYYTGRETNVFTFGPTNSIQIKFAEAICPFSVTVTLAPTPQSSFRSRVTAPTCTPPAPLSDDGVAPPEITCNETVVMDVGGDPTSFCAIYSVSATPNNCYNGPVFDERVDYLIGWLSPVKGNKHDFFMLRDPDSLDPNDNGNACFIQNITNGTVIRNYIVGDLRDPGLGGRSCCPSDYVVARQRIRPVAK